MALNIAKGTVSSWASSTAVVTGLGFAPKALIMWAADESHTAGDTFAGNAVLSYGFGTYRGGTPQHHCLTFWYDDNVGTANCGRRWWSSALLEFATGVGIAVRVGLTSLDSDGFTLGFTFAASGTREMHYLAIGGSDITDANVVTDDWPTSGATFAIAGMGFQPDAMFLMGGQADATSPGTNTDNLLFAMGACSSAADEWSLSIVATDGDTMSSAMNNNSLFRSDSSLCLLTVNADTEDANCNLNAFASDGATMNNANAPAAAMKIIALGLKGGQWKAGSKAKTASAAADDFTFTPAFVPAGVFLAQGRGTVSGTVVAADAQVDIGATTNGSGTAEGHAGVTIGENINTRGSRIWSTTKALDTYIPGAPATSDAAADTTGISSGAFQLTWVAAGVPELVGYVVAGSTPTMAPPPHVMRRNKQYAYRRAYT